MKLPCILGIVIVLITGFAVKADVPVFGNNPLGPPPPGDMTLNVGYLDNPNLQYVGVFFTPTENLDVSSVTLWMTGYSDQVEQNYLTLSVGIYETYFQGDTATIGTSLASLTSPTPNNGSSAPFTFADSAGSITLQANEEYDFVVWGYPVMPFPNEPDNELVTLEEGDTPTGDAVYDGAYYWIGSGGAATTPSDTPAFTINTVPEPDEYALIGIGVVPFCFSRYRWLKSSRPAGIAGQ